MAIPRLAAREIAAPFRPQHLISASGRYGDIARHMNKWNESRQVWYSFDLDLLQRPLHRGDTAQSRWKAQKQHEKKARWLLMLAGTSVGAAWVTLAADLLQHREQVPITGRNRYSSETSDEVAAREATVKQRARFKAFTEDSTTACSRGGGQRAAKAKVKENGKDKAEDGTINHGGLRGFFLWLLDWLEQAIQRRASAARLHRVVNRISKAAGLEHVYWSVKLLEGSGQSCLYSTPSRSLYLLSLIPPRPWSCSEY